MDRLRRMETEICSVDQTCVLADDCDLKIKGKMVINKNKIRI